MVSARVMRPAETAAYMKISMSSLAKLRMAGAGPRYSKVSRMVLYEQAEVDAWLESLKRESTKP